MGYWENLKEQVKTQTFSVIGTILGIISLFIGLYTGGFIPINTMSITGEVVTMHIPIWVIGIVLLTISMVVYWWKK